MEKRENQFSKLEKAIVIGMPIVFGLAPIVYGYTKTDFVNYSDGSTAILIMSLITGCVTTLIGLFGGRFISKGLRNYRLNYEKIQRQEMINYINRLIGDEDRRDYESIFRI